MKNKTLLFLISALLTFAACNGQKSNSQSSDELIFEKIDVATFKQLMQDDTRIILDVRTPSEIEGGAVEGHRALDYRSPDFEKQLKSLDREKEYLVYCKSGGRSGKTATLMKKLGFKKVYDLKGGYSAYQRN